MPTQKLKRSILEAAIVGFESQKKDIDFQIAELKQMLNGGGGSHDATPEAAPGKRKKFSAAVRRKMALAQKTRWAKLKGESEPPVVMTPEPAKAKRTLSKEGRANIVAALKKRWREKKVATAKPVAPKKASAKNAVTKRKLSPARKAALVANLAKARAARAAKATAGA